MFLYIPNTKRQAVVEGSCVKSVACEACGGTFSYELVRAAVGEDKSLFSWNEASSFRKAIADAQANLTRRLEREVDAVSCPDCEWVQQSMIEAVREQSYAGLRSFSRGGLLIGGGILAVTLIGLIYHLATGESNSGDSTLSLIVLGLVFSAIGLAPGIGCWLLRTFLNSCFDPNRHFRTVNR